MADVFISYKRDERPAIERLAATLRDLNLSVWFDASMTAGDSFSDEIDREARQSNTILVCWSPTARESRWVKAEALIGFERDTLAAAYVAGPDGFSAPAPFNTVHAEDLRAWVNAPNETHAGWRSLLRRIGKLTGRPDLEDWGALDITSAAALRVWVAAHQSSPLLLAAEALLRARETEDAERPRFEREARERRAKEEVQRQDREQAERNRVQDEQDAVVSPSLITIVLCFVAAFVAGLANTAWNFVPRDYGIPAAEFANFSQLASYAFIVGALVCGALADRVGRKRVLIGCMVLLGAAMLASVGGVALIGTARVIAGLATGAVTASIAALAIDSGRADRPVSSAATALSGLLLGGILGGSLIGMLGMQPLLLPMLGGGVVLMALPLLAAREPLTREATRIGFFDALFGGGRAFRTVLTAIAFALIWPMGFTAFNLLRPFILESGTSQDLLLMFSTFNFAGVAGALILGQLGDAIGPRWTIIPALFVTPLAVLFLLISTHAGAPASFDIMLVAAVGFFSVGAQYALYGVAVSRYPAPARGAAAGLGVAIGRLALVAVSPLMTTLRPGGDETNLSAFALVPSAIIAIIVVFILARRKKKPAAA